jgi:hypothetical protein
MKKAKSVKMFAIKIGVFIVVCLFFIMTHNVLGLCVVVEIRERPTSP